MQSSSQPSMRRVVADAIEENLETLAVAQSYENGKPVRETLAADSPLAADHVRPFAAAVRSEEGRISEIDDQTTLRDEHEGLRIADDTLYGLGAGVGTRDGSRAFRMGRAIKAGRAWTNCYHQYPAHAAFGGYKSSGVGRENHVPTAPAVAATEAALERGVPFVTRSRSCSP
jgi:acyl-CoA reductase-like NAD-dependent aldehyde dehydrogenase